MANKVDTIKIATLKMAKKVEILKKEKTRLVTELFSSLITRPVTRLEQLRTMKMSTIEGHRRALQRFN